MSDLAADVMPFGDLPAWRALEREYQAGDVPHCRAVSAPLAWHAGLLNRLACLTLGEADFPMAEHPDLAVAGAVGQAPDVAGCRALIQEMALKPVISTRRLGVVMAADRLLPSAANSLLKLAEEPPSHSCILFLLEGNGLLPTLRSRSRFTVLSAPLDVEAKPMPEDWPAWIEKVRAGDAAEAASELAGWGAWALARGDVALASRLERLRLIAETKNLSVPMLCDLLILVLREELPFEHLFGDFR